MARCWTLDCLCGINVILNMTVEIALTKDISKLLNGFKRVSIIDKTSENISRVIDESLCYIDTQLAKSNNTRLLIHCRQGISRSATILICYLIWKENITYTRAASKMLMP